MTSAKTTLALILSTCLLAAPALAKGPMGERGGHPMGQVLQQLDLDSNQRDQIRDLMQAHGNKMRDQRDSDLRDQHRQAMKQLLQQESFDQAAAEALIDEQAIRMRTMMLQRLELQHSVYQLLTPAQRTQFLELMDERFEKRDERRENRQNRQNKFND